MRKLIFIGTLHAGLTPKDELENLLIKYKPDQLLLEIKQKDILNGNISACPDEMIFAYN